ncbi:uncharacterized protein LOC143447100 isoform X2 [Clavelina lepadiformis]|uniref:uncharacterized protein LOC143447100 isoform X2 n=1 Tax=Clavelina lepadiformis TaxID=159417 RepID=UPI0040418C87
MATLARSRTWPRSQYKGHRIKQRSNRKRSRIKMDSLPNVHIRQPRQTEILIEKLIDSQPTKTFRQIVRLMSGDWPGMDFTSLGSRTASNASASFIQRPGMTGCAIPQPHLAQNDPNRPPRSLEAGIFHAI